jgi:hypothetical protein
VQQPSSRRLCAVQKHRQPPSACPAGQRQIEATDEEIDALVYELYGLTEEEMIVEGRSAEWDEGTGHPPT